MHFLAALLDYLLGGSTVYIYFLFLLQWAPRKWFSVFFRNAMCFEIVFKLLISCTFWPQTLGAHCTYLHSLILFPTGYASSKIYECFINWHSLDLFYAAKLTFFFLFGLWWYFFICYITVISSSCRPFPFVAGLCSSGKANFSLI